MLFGRKCLPLWTFVAGIGFTLLAMDQVRRTGDLTSPLDGPPLLTGFPCNDWLRPEISDGDSWDAGVKLVARPARCPVRGFAIEELDPYCHFRRTYAYGFDRSPEGRTHFLSYFRAAQDRNLHTRKRRVYLDLGGRFFDSSLVWFMRIYPLDFTEYYVFEADSSLFEIPPNHDPAEEVLYDNPKLDLKRPVGRPVPVTNNILNRVKVYNVFVSNRDGEVEYRGKKTESWNITRFIKEQLELTAGDTLVVKMDIEGAEYDILRDWLADASMADIVDELFVEIHYKHPGMSNHHWDNFAPHTLEEATQLFVDLRKAGFFVHAWP